MVDKHNSFVQQQMSTELTHHGVKGMKWGVRKDKVSRKEVRQYNKEQRKTFYENKVSKAMTTAAKDPESLIALGTPYNGNHIVTGKEFLTYLGNKGIMDMRLTETYASKNLKTGKYEVDKEFRSQYKKKSRSEIAANK